LFHLFVSPFTSACSHFSLVRAAHGSTGTYNRAGWFSRPHGRLISLFAHFITNAINITSFINRLG